MLAADAETARDRQVTTARNSARIRFVFKVNPSYDKSCRGKQVPPAMDGCGLDRIPADHEQNGRNGSVDDSFGDWADDGVIRDADGVCSLVAVAGHIAAFDGTVDESLGSCILRIGELLRAASQSELEADHVAVHLDLGKAVLAAERGQLPAGTGFDLDVVNLDRAKGIVGDADIRGRRDRAVRTNCDGEDGRDVTFILVAAGSPSSVPSEVEDRLTLDVPVPPETSTVVGSAADAPMARLAIRQTARSRDTSFFMFFIVSSPFSFC